MLGELSQTYNCILMCITESHLRKEIRDAEIAIDGYQLHRMDRREGRKKGGVAVYVRDSVAPYTRLLTSESNSEVEYIILYIDKWSTVVVTLYRPPGCLTENFIGVLETITSEVKRLGNPEPTVIINGDFNLPNANWDEPSIYGGTLADRLQANALFNLVDELILKQIVNSATRGRNILDLFFTNNEEIISNLRVEDTVMSDHRLLMIETTLENWPIKPTHSKDYSSFSTLNFFSENTNWASINNAIADVNWDQEFSDMSTTEMYCLMKSKLYHISSLFTPVRKQRKTNIPKDRKILMRKRTKLTKKIALGEDECRTRQQLANIEQKLVESHEAELITREEKAVAAISRNPKYFYHYARMKSKIRSKIGPLKHNGTLVSEPQQLSEALNIQYVSAFSRQNRQQTNETWQPTSQRITEFELRDIDFNKADIEQSISSIRRHASAGPDGIPAILLKQCMNTIAEPIYILWKASLDTGVIPPLLKEGLITPIYKGGDRTEPKNYRPVTLTSHVIKVFERTIVKKLNEYLEDNILYNDKQHGFRHGRSCLSQLLQHRMDVLQSLENETTAEVIYVDFAKAFDKVDHLILLQKLSHIGIRGKLLQWIRCFLDNRSQSVVVEGVSSDRKDVLSGVAQGSVIGPILFLIFISDIDTNMSHCNASSFADDTRLLSAVKNDDDRRLTQIDLEQIYEWAKNNNMMFNSSKFELLRYDHPNVEPSDDGYKTPEGINIQQCKHLRDLGVIMSDDGNFQQQIDNVVTKARQMIGWVLRTFKTRESTALLTLYKTLILPLIEYCCVLWNPSTTGQIRKLEAVQRTYTARMTGMQNMNYWQRLKHLKMYSLERRRERYIIIYIWKIINGLVPNLNNAHTIKTANRGRRGLMCIVPPISTRWTRLQTLREGSIAVLGPRLFNVIPQEVREYAGNLETCKKHLDEFLQTVVDQPPLPHYHQISEGNSVLQQLRMPDERWRTSAT